MWQSDKGTVKNKLDAVVPPLWQPQPNPARNDGLTLNVIWAESADYAIGVNNKLPWHLPEDLQYFKKKTEGDTVIMGRNTWFSLPEKNRPLPGRRNIVISSHPEMFHQEDVEVFPTINEALEACSGTVWVIGGAQLYESVIDIVDHIYMTKVDVTIGEEADAYRPSIPYKYRIYSGWPSVEHWEKSVTGLRYRFLVWAYPSYSSSS